MLPKIPIFLILGTFPLGAGATTIITTATGTMGADSYVQFGAATSNFGTQTSVVTKYGGNDTGTTNRKIYLRFDVSSLGSAVTSAQLDLTVALNNGGSTNTTPQNFTLALYGLNDGSTAGGGFLGEDWDETAINWNNGPANIVSGAGAGNAVRTGTGTANGGEAALLAVFNVTATDTAGSVVLASSGSSLVDFLNLDTDGQVTFIITRTGWTSGGGTPTPTQGNSNLAFSSREAASGAPSLTLELVPEPGSTLLLAAGASLLAFRRRR